MLQITAFPTDRAEKRRVLMDAVESVRDVLEAGEAESEETGALPQTSVNALYDSGLFRLKMPHVLGGAEADLVTQLDVLEEVSRIEPSAGWCLMIGSASLGGLGAFLPDDALEEVFAGGKPPRTAGSCRSSRWLPCPSRTATGSTDAGPLAAACGIPSGFRQARVSLLKSLDTRACCGSPCPPTR